MRGPAGSPVTDPVVEWLSGEEAARAARRWAARRGLSHLWGDVLGTAVADALRHHRAHPDWEAENPAAYGTTLLRRALARVLSADRPPVPGGDGERISFVPLDGVELPEAGAVPDAPHDGLLDEMRATVEALGGPGWLVSAALTHLTLSVDEVDAPRGLPAPVAGSTPRQAHCWPALALAGEHDLFPDVDGDPPARRRKRSRRIRAVLDRLEAAAARVCGPLPGHGGGDHDG